MGGDIQRWNANFARYRRAKRERDVATLIELLKTPPHVRDDRGKPLADLRMLALRAVVKTGSGRAAAAVVPLLADENIGVRVAAAQALGRLGDPRAIPPLLETLGDGRDFVDQVRGWPGWRTALRDRSTVTGDQETNLRGKALTSLASLGAVEAVPTVIALLEHDDRYVRRWAARLLRKLGDPAAVEPLRAAERREPLWRRRQLRSARRVLERRPDRTTPSPADCDRE